MKNDGENERLAACLFNFAFFSDSRGQAMVEFAVALVVVLVLVAGLIQIGQLSRAQTTTMIEARAAAGRLAMAEGVPIAEPAATISDWLTGPDQRRYTCDDAITVFGNAYTLPVELVEHTQMDAIPNEADYTLSTLMTPTWSPGNLFMVKGEASESVAILPIIRRMVYTQPTLVVAGDAWLVWNGGIY